MTPIMYGLLVVLAVGIALLLLKANWWPGIVDSRGAPYKPMDTTACFQACRNRMDGLHFAMASLESRLEVLEDHKERTMTTET